jgi:hypothetical protein
MSRIDDGCLGFLEPLEDLVLLKPNWLYNDPILPLDAFWAHRKCLILASLKKDPGKIIGNADCLEGLDPVRNIYDLYWVWLTVLFIPECYAQAVIVVVRCPY